MLACLSLLSIVWNKCARHAGSGQCFRQPCFDGTTRGSLESNFWVVTACGCSYLALVCVGYSIHKFSLQATRDHHGLSMYSGHYTASIRCCKIFYCYDSKITKFEMIDTKNSSTAYVVMYKLHTWCFSDKNRRMGVLITPWHWDILSIPLKASRRISNETCGLDDVFRSDDLGSCSWTPFIIYIPYIITAILVIWINYFKRHTYQKLVWPCWFIEFDTVIVPCLVSSVHFSCILRYSLYHNRDIGTLWQCRLVSSTPSQYIGLFF